MKEFKGCNGAKIVINEATWGDVRRLKKVLAEELLKLGIDLDKGFFGADKKDLFIGSKLFELIKNVYLTLEASDKFNDEIMNCLKYCTYDNIQIKESLFDDKIEAREDYYDMVIGCLEVNLAPFIKKIYSKFMEQMKLSDNDKQELN